MTKRKPLQWHEVGNSGAMIPGCRICWDLINQPGMVEAIASVGIDRTGGIDVRQMVDQYHASRHQEE